MSHVYIVILAGGNGERLWPLSTPEKPKQLLSLIGEKTLLGLTLDRASILTDASNILVVTCERQEALIRHEVGDRGQVVVEPEQRNTAPAILYACQRILAYDQYATVIVMPADHYIDDNNAFFKQINRAVHLAQQYERLVLLGITPTAPMTGYGYIQYHVEKGIGAHLVTQFHEKPRLEIATNYLHRDDMLWNSGIVIGQIQTFMEQFMFCAPLLYEEMQGYLQGLFDYECLPSLSFDYAVLEKTRELLVLPVTFAWSDVGDLRTFLNIKERIHKSPEKLIQLHAENNIVQTDAQTVVCIGVDDLCIVQEAGILMIVSADKVSMIKDAYAAYTQQQLVATGQLEELEMPPSRAEALDELS